MGGYFLFKHRLGYLYILGRCGKVLGLYSYIYFFFSRIQASMDIYYYGYNYVVRTYGVHHNIPQRTYTGQNTIFVNPHTMQNHNMALPKPNYHEVHNFICWVRYTEGGTPFWDTTTLKN